MQENIIANFQIFKSMLLGVLIQRCNYCIKARILEATKKYRHTPNENILLCPYLNFPFNGLSQHFRITLHVSNSLRILAMFHKMQKEFNLLLFLYLRRNLFRYLWFLLLKKALNSLLNTYYNEKSL